MSNHSTRYTWFAKSFGLVNHIIMSIEQGVDEENYRDDINALMSSRIPNYEEKIQHEVLEYLMGRLKEATHKVEHLPSTVSPLVKEQLNEIIKKLGLLLEQQILINRGELPLSDEIDTIAFKLGDREYKFTFEHTGKHSKVKCDKDASELQMELMEMQSNSAEPDAVLLSGIMMCELVLGKSVNGSLNLIAQLANKRGSEWETYYLYMLFSMISRYELNHVNHVNTYRTFYNDFKNGLEHLKRTGEFPENAASQGSLVNVPIVQTNANCYTIQFTWTAPAMVHNINAVVMENGIILTQNGLPMTSADIAWVLLTLIRRGGSALLIKLFLLALISRLRSHFFTSTRAFNMFFERLIAALPEHGRFRWDTFLTENGMNGLFGSTSYTSIWETMNGTVEPPQPVEVTQEHSAFSSLQLHHLAGVFTGVTVQIDGREYKFSFENNRLAVMIDGSEINTVRAAEELKRRVAAWAQVQSSEAVLCEALTSFMLSVYLGFTGNHEAIRGVMPQAIENVRFFAPYTYRGRDLLGQYMLLSMASHMTKVQDPLRAYATAYETISGYIKPPSYRSGTAFVNLLHYRIQGKTMTVYYANDTSETIDISGEEWMLNGRPLTAEEYAELFVGMQGAISDGFVDEKEVKVFYKLLEILRTRGGFQHLTFLDPQTFEATFTRMYRYYKMTYSYSFKTAGLSGYAYGNKIAEFLKSSKGGAVNISTEVKEAEKDMKARIGKLHAANGGQLRAYLGNFNNRTEIVDSDVTLVSMFSKEGEPTWLVPILKRERNGVAQIFVMYDLSETAVNKPEFLAIRLLESDKLLYTDSYVSLLSDIIAVIRNNGEDLDLILEELVAFLYLWLGYVHLKRKIDADLLKNLEDALKSCPATAGLTNLRRAVIDRCCTMGIIHFLPRYHLESMVRNLGRLREPDHEWDAAFRCDIQRDQISCAQHRDGGIVTLPERLTGDGMDLANENKLAYSQIMTIIRRLLRICFSDNTEIHRVNFEQLKNWVMAILYIVSVALRQLQYASGTHFMAEYTSELMGYLKNLDFTFKDEDYYKEFLAWLEGTLIVKLFADASIYFSLWSSYSSSILVRETVEDVSRMGAERQNAYVEVERVKGRTALRRRARAKANEEHKKKVAVSLSNIEETKRQIEENKRQHEMNMKQLLEYEKTVEAQREKFEQSRRNLEEQYKEYKAKEEQLIIKRKELFEMRSHLEAKSLSLMKKRQDLQIQLERYLEKTLQITRLEEKNKKLDAELTELQYRIAVTLEERERIVICIRNMELDSNNLAEEIKQNEVNHQKKLLEELQRTLERDEAELRDKQAQLRKEEESLIMAQEQFKTDMTKIEEQLEIVISEEQETKIKIEEAEEQYLELQDEERELVEDLKRYTEDYNLQITQLQDEQVQDEEARNRFEQLRRERETQNARLRSHLFTEAISLQPDNLAMTLRQRHAHNGECDIYFVTLCIKGASYARVIKVFDSKATMHMSIDSEAIPTTDVLELFKQYYEGFEHMKNVNSEISSILFLFMIFYLCLTAGEREHVTRALGDFVKAAKGLTEEHHKHFNQKLEESKYQKVLDSLAAYLETRTAFSPVNELVSAASVHTYPKTTWMHEFTIAGNLMRLQINLHKKEMKLFGCTFSESMLGNIIVYLMQYIFNQLRSTGNKFVVKEILTLCFIMFVSEHEHKGVYQTHQDLFLSMMETIVHDFMHIKDDYSKMRTEKEMRAFIESVDSTVRQALFHSHIEQYSRIRLQRAPERTVVVQFIAEKHNRHMVMIILDNRGKEVQRIKFHRFMNNYRATVGKTDLSRNEIATMAQECVLAIANCSYNVNAALGECSLFVALYFASEGKLDATAFLAALSTLILLPNPHTVVQAILADDKSDPYAEIYDMHHRCHNATKPAPGDTTFKILPHKPEEGPMPRAYLQDSRYYFNLGANEICYDLSTNVAKIGSTNLDGDQLKAEMYFSLARLSRGLMFSSYFELCREAMLCAALVKASRNVDSDHLLKLLKQCLKKALTVIKDDATASVVSAIVVSLMNFVQRADQLDILYIEHSLGFTTNQLEERQVNFRRTDLVYSPEGKFYIVHDDGHYIFDLQTKDLRDFSDGGRTLATTEFVTLFSNVANTPGSVNVMLCVCVLSQADPSIKTFFQAYISPEHYALLMGFSTSFTSVEAFLAAYERLLNNLE